MRCIGTLEINARTSSVAGGDTGTKYKHLNMVTSIISFRPSCITPQLLTTITLPPPPHLLFHTHPAQLMYHPYTHILFSTSLK
jgi:hypothetical protein